MTWSLGGLQNEPAVTRFQVQILVATIIAVVGAYALSAAVGAPAPTIAGPFLVLALALIAIVGTVLLVGYIGWLAIWEHEPQPILRLRAVWVDHVSPELLLRRIFPLVAAFIFCGAFGTYKSLIPTLHPFAWDTSLSDLDRTVFGTDAWRLTHAFIGPIGTGVIDTVYGLWFVEWAFAVIYFSMFASAPLQRRFFLSFFTVWTLIGVLLAIIFSSAGPCFLDLIGHPYAYRYANIPMEGAPGAVFAQNLLASEYRAGNVGVFLGISAMPSVHVAISTLVALAVRRLSSFVFVMACMFYALILIGSIHLGWHYGSDGVLATILVLGIWRAFRAEPPISLRHTVPAV